MSHDPLDLILGEAVVGISPSRAPTARPSLDQVEEPADSFEIALGGTPDELECHQVERPKVRWWTAQQEMQLGHGEHERPKDRSQQRPETNAARRAVEPEIDLGHAHSEGMADRLLIGRRQMISRGPRGRGRDTEYNDGVLRSKCIGAAAEGQLSKPAHRLPGRQFRAWHWPVTPGLRLAPRHLVRGRIEAAFFLRDGTQLDVSPQDKKNATTPYIDFQSMIAYNSRFIKWINAHVNLPLPGEVVSWPSSATKRQASALQPWRASFLWNQTTAVFFPIAIAHCRLKSIY